MTILSRFVPMLGSYGGMAQETERGAVPWYVWLLIIMALLLFAVFVYFWWIRSREEEERKPAVPQVKAELPPARIGAPEVKAAAPEVKTEMPVLRADLPELGEAAKAAAVPGRPDDLKLIEGIGPKIASTLNAAGILTFAQLAISPVELIREILGKADPRLLKLADPTTWAEQAGLAAKGDFEALQKLQDALKGGRRVD